jgi:hypothetical protein
MISVLDEVHSEEFRNLPPAILDESRSPELAVLTRFARTAMLRGTIEAKDERWVWHFVLDTSARHEGSAGIATSYEAARTQMWEELAKFNVQVMVRRDSYPPRKLDPWEERQE